MADENSVETREEALKGEGEPGVVSLWLRAIKMACEREEKWREKVKTTQERYRAEKSDAKLGKGNKFNLLYSQTDTIRTAIYNSEPVPDVRRRYGDEDPIAKFGSDIVERALTSNADAYDFHGVLKGAAFDDALKGRGVARVDLENDEVDAEVKEGEPPRKEIVYQRVTCSLVHYDDFCHGPGRTWSEVPWVAFKRRYTRQELIEEDFSDAETINLDWSESGQDDKDDDNTWPKDQFKRAEVWQIWDKDKREVVYIAPAHKDRPLRVEPDPLQLRDFFPMPAPIYDIMDSDSLVPIVPFTMWEKQADELDDLTGRIKKITGAIRARGLYAGQFNEMDLLKQADDGDLVPAESAMAAMAQGGIDRAIWMWPVESLIVVLRELVLQREQVKQTIFELTGVSDIMRGQSEPGETLGAQRIKAQWGSMRLQDRQSEMARFARDILRLKAEIMVEQFDLGVLRMMTLLEPTEEQVMAAVAIADEETKVALQAGAAQPADLVWQAALEMLSNDASRHFRIDIETDSTIAGDMAHQQEQMASFTQGSASFFQAMGPAVESGAVPLEVAVAIYQGFARKFKLGRQAEDALDRLGKAAQEKANQPQQEKPDPALVKAQADAQAQQAELQMKQQSQQVEQQMRAQEQQAKQGADQAKIAGELQLKREEMMARLQIEQQAMAAKLAMEREAMQAKLQLEREKAEADVQLQGWKAQQAAEVAETTAKAKAKPNGANA